MTSIKIQCPAKINLDLKVLGKREDGFHNIESIMQTISLYDYLTISIIDSEQNEIHIEGNSKEIPYDKTNLVYKAAELFLQTAKLPPKTVLVYIEKNIPIAAGLAGGSTDAAGMILGLNILSNNILTHEQMHKVCAQLGSDINVCLQGGCLKTSGRGEQIEQLEYKKFDLNLIKPIQLGISAKEAYTKFSQKIQTQTDIESRNLFVNDLEWAVINDYAELKYIKEKYPTAIMTGSGSTYYSLQDEFTTEEGYWIKNGLTSIDKGVCQVV